MLVAFTTFAIGFVAGWLGQRSRMCFIGGYRDFFLIGDKALLKGTLAFFLAAWLTLAASARLFGDLGLASYPDLAEAFSSRHFWLTLGGGLALGLFTTLSDACPLRHHVLAGQGRIDSLLFIAGLVAGVPVYYAIIINLPWL